MDDSSNTPTNSANNIESFVNKSTSIKLLQSLLLVWGSVSLLYFLFNLIFGSDWLSFIPNSLTYPISILAIVDPIFIYHLGVDTQLFPLVVGVGAIICGLGLLQYSRYSLSVSRWYTSVLLLIMLGYFLLTVPSLPSLWKSILEINEPSSGWDFSGLIIVSALGEVILAGMLIVLVFALTEILKVLKANIPSRKTSFEKFGKLSYLPSLLMIIWFAYASYSYYQSLQPRDLYGTPVNVKSSKIISENHTSPDNVYTVKESPNPPYQVIFAVYDNQGNVINETAYSIGKEIVDNTRTIGCDCKVSFKGWINNYTFAIKTIKEDGMEYEDVIDINKLISE